MPPPSAAFDGKPSPFPETVFFKVPKIPNRVCTMPIINRNYMKNGNLKAEKTTKMGTQPIENHNNCASNPL